MHTFYTHRQHSILNTLYMLLLSSPSTIASPTHRHARHIGLQVVPQPQGTLLKQHIKACSGVCRQFGCTKTFEVLVWCGATPYHLSLERALINPHALCVHEEDKEDGEGDEEEEDGVCDKV